MAVRATAWAVGPVFGWHGVDRCCFWLDIIRRSWAGRPGPGNVAEFGGMVVHHPPMVGFWA